VPAFVDIGSMCEKNKLDAGGRGASTGVEQVRVVTVQFPRAQVEIASNHCREFLYGNKSKLGGWLLL
jgi:hypothetical protein